MADTTAAVAVRGYRDIAVMWIRASMTYRASFWMMAVSNFVIGGLDFVGILIMFSAVDSSAASPWPRSPSCTAAPGSGSPSPTCSSGPVERIGQLIRLGTLDAMMVRPVPLLAQVCADQFALRRIARVLQTGLIFGIGCGYVDWTPTKALLAVVMICSGAVIFFAVFLGFACIQFWTADSSEVANAFTYGGNTMPQYPLTIFPEEPGQGADLRVAAGLRQLVPLASTSSTAPTRSGCPSGSSSPRRWRAAVLLAASALVWRSGVRHYTSTGS